MKSSASVSESSGSQFFTTMTGPDAFDESRFVMTLVLEGRTGKEIPESSKLEFLEKFIRC